MTARAESDPLFFDAQQLQTLASPTVVRRGIAYFKENRVTDLSWDADHISAMVEGSEPLPYEVHISLDDDLEPAIECDCPFDWEPACKHAVATLLAYGAQQPLAAVQLEGAADSAVDARIRRGRSEVSVKHVAGDRWLGAWEARSLTSDGHARLGGSSCGR